MSINDAAFRCTYCQSLSRNPQCDNCGAPAERIPVAAPKPVRAVHALAPKPGLASMLAEIRQMSREELAAFVTMPDGREYSYWRHGAGMTAQQRVVYGAAFRQLGKLDRSAPRALPTSGDAPPATL